MHKQRQTELVSIEERLQTRVLCLPCVPSASCARPPALSAPADSAGGGDRDVILAAVAQQAWALRFAAVDLRADREVALAAAVRDGGAVQFALGGLRWDPTFFALQAPLYRR